jgi:hypothetical protein
MATYAHGLDSSGKATAPLIARILGRGIEPRTPTVAVIPCLRVRFSVFMVKLS